MSHEIDQDYPPSNPAEWRDEARPGEARSKRAVGFAGGVPSRRPRARRRTTYIAIILLLVVLIGGAYEAYVNGWIDLGSITGLASRSGTGSRSVDNPGQVVFAGNARDLASPAGNLVQQDKADPSVTWIRSSLREADASGPTEGASLQIKGPYATDLVGKHIRLTISARAPDQGTPAPFAVAYSAAGVGSSGWVVFTPTTEFDDYSFEYQVPAKVGTAQYIGIWSDISGRGAPLAIRSIAIRVLD